MATKENIEKAFNLFDTNKDQMIDIEEFRYALPAPDPEIPSPGRFSDCESQTIENVTTLSVCYSVVDVDGVDESEETTT